jgi:hypothetical protein
LLYLRGVAVILGRESPMVRFRWFAILVNAGAHRRYFRDNRRAGWEVRQRRALSSIDKCASLQM